VGETQIVNASPLIFLGAAGRLALLEREGSRVIAPAPVVAEVEAKGPHDPVAAALAAAKWIERAPAVPSPESVLVWDLGPGESSVLALALAMPGAAVVIDDLAARRCARALGLPLRGTLGIVLEARRAGRIESARALLTEMKARGMYLSDDVLDQALAEVGE
jgi:predicted nucleic acid-binding protein